jgi:protein-disulfide isomerase
MSFRRNTVCLAASLLLIASAALAQSGAGAAPSAAPQAPAAQAGQSDPAKPVGFPPPDQRNFTAAQPTIETVNSFLKAQIGFDPNRIWQVEAIQKTMAPGYSDVTVLIADKSNPSQQQPARFLITPDQKFIIQGAAILPFGANPFAEIRKTLDEKAHGPARGAEGKQLLMVEFSDLECPHCKAAQATMDRLVKEYPQARFVYQNYPIDQIHPWALKAAEFSTCVAEHGSDAFYKFLQLVFDQQEQITPDNATEKLTAVATAAGVDGAKAASCATTPEAKSKVTDSMALAEAVGVSSTPTLFVNGRPLPLGQNLPYETLKTIVDYQAKMDGVKVAPSLNSLSK